MCKVPVYQNQILIVDDDDLFLDLLESGLSDLPYQILKALSGNEAMQIVQRTTPNLIITDMCMPDGDGLELLSNIRPQWPDLPVIMLFSGDPQRPELTKDHMIEAGAQKVFQKPVSFLDLRQTVHNLLALQKPKRWFKKKTLENPWFRH